MAAAGEVGVHCGEGFTDAAAEASEEEVECGVVAKLVEEGEALAADDLHAREQLAVAVTGIIQLDRRPAAVGVAVRGHAQSRQRVGLRPSGGPSVVAVVRRDRRRSRARVGGSVGCSLCGGRFSRR